VCISPAPISFCFKTQRGFVDGADVRLITRGDDDDAVFRHCVAARVFFGIESNQRAARDVDVAIVLSPGAREAPLDAAIRYAGLSSGRRHDGLDVSVFQALPLYVRHRILVAHRILWVRDEAAHDALYEVMPFTEAVKELVLNGASTAEIKRAAIKEGMKTLRMSGITKVGEGVTTIEEILRVTMAD